MKKETKVTSKIVTNIMKCLLWVHVIYIMLGLFFILSSVGLTFVFGPTLDRMLHTYRNCFSHVLMTLISLTLFQVVLACLWKPARKWKLLMVFIILENIIIVEGYIDYTTRKDPPVVIFKTSEMPSGCCLAPEPHKLEGTPCQSQDDCGGVNSGAYCDYNKSQKRNTCTESHFWSLNCDQIKRNCDDVEYKYTYSWDASKQVTYWGAQNLCASIGKKLYDAHNLEEVCENFRKERSFESRTTGFWISGGRLLVVKKGKSYNKCWIEQKVAGKVSYANCICQ